MAKILFPAGLTIDMHDMGMEEVEYYTQAWNLKRVQMQKGFYRGSLIVAHTPHMQLMRTPHSHGLLLRGDFPKGVVLIAFMKTKADVTFQNRISAKHEMKILKSGDEIDFLCNGESETYTIAVDEKLFYEAYDAYFWEDFTLHSKDEPIYIDPKVHSEFIQGFEKRISYLMQDHQEHHIDKNYERIESEILEYVFSSIYVENSQKHRQKFQIKKARDLMHQSIDGSINISELTKELGISERLLHHAFKANYGITPKRYLLNLRMYKVRQELLCADPMNQHITEIVLKYNFFNLSTFSEAYKNMFGESPSVTLKRTL